MHFIGAAASYILSPRVDFLPVPCKIVTNSHDGLLVLQLGCPRPRINALPEP